MDVSKFPIAPTDMTLPKMDKRIPVGSIRIDHSDDNFSKYSDIARDNGLGDIVNTPLWFNFLDNEYGIQDNYQHQYDEVRPYARSEPFRYYAGSANEYIEFMLRFFAVESSSLIKSLEVCVTNGNPKLPENPNLPFEPGPSRHIILTFSIPYD